MTSGALALFEDLVEQIGKIDEVLNTEDDAKASSRRKILNELVAQSADRVKPNLDSLVNNLSQLSDEDLPGIFYGFVRGLEKAFGKKASEIVDKMIPEPDPNAEKAPEIPEDQKNSLLITRKDLLEKARVIGDLAVKTDELSEADYEAKLPKRRNVTGKRGKRAISFYTLSVGDKSFDSLGEVAKEFGYDKASDLTKAIRESGTNLTKPPKSFSYTLKDGSVLEAVDTRTEDEREDDESDDSPEETED